MSNVTHYLFFCSLRLSCCIVAFDNPRHAVTGYVRLRQYEYKDGSLSSTWLEVDVKYPGLTDRNVTHGHNWAVFVNQVGEDAFNPVPTVKCIAAGFAWNPYLVAKDNPLYKKDCSPHNQLRCEMGDLSGKHGPLTIGGHRAVLTDVNLPLAGNFSVMRRSIVLFDKNGLKLACANILPDVHLVTSVAIKRHPSFSVDRFLDHMRSSLQTAAWLVAGEVDSLRSILDGECVQITIHFYGEIILLVHLFDQKPHSPPLKASHQQLFFSLQVHMRIKINLNSAT